MSKKSRKNKRHRMAAELSLHERDELARRDAAKALNRISTFPPITLRGRPKRPSAIVQSSEPTGISTPQHERPLRIPTPDNARSVAHAAEVTRPHNAGRVGFAVHCQICRVAVGEIVPHRDSVGVNGRRMRVCDQCWRRLPGDRRSHYQHRRTLSQKSRRRGGASSSVYVRGTGWNPTRGWGRFTSDGFLIRPKRGHS